jgi:hypothetical protein
MTLLPAECILSISNARNSEEIVRQLSQESTDRKEGLILRRVVVTPPVCIALLNILRHRAVEAAEGGGGKVVPTSSLNENTKRNEEEDESSCRTSAAAAALSSWKRVELRNIEGDVSSAISTCMTWNAIEELRIVMNTLIPPHPAWLALGRGIQVNTKLTCLRITVEWMGRGMKELADGLASPSCVLKVLDLSWSYWQDETGETTTFVTTTIDQQQGTETQVEGTTEWSSSGENDGDRLATNDRTTTVTMELARGLRHNTSLKVLRLGGCRLHDDQLQPLVDALRYHPTLRTLDLNGNTAGSLTSQAVARLLVGDVDGSVEDDDNASPHQSQQAQVQSSQLASLDISFQNSRVSDARLDIAILASALRSNTSLQVLDFSNDGITDQDLDLLCHGLSSGSTTTKGLRELELTRNNITDQGMITLSRHLRRFRQLKRLSIWGNPFEAIGAQALADGLIQNVSLEHVELFRTFSGSSEQIAFYTNLNRAGRHLLVLDDRNEDCSSSSTVVVQGKNPHSRPKHPTHVPLALWPLVLGRIDRIPLANGSTCTRLDLLHYMVRWGPALLHSR